MTNEEYLALKKGDRVLVGGNSKYKNIKATVVSKYDTKIKLPKSNTEFITNSKVRIKPDNCNGKLIYYNYRVLKVLKGE